MIGTLVILCLGILVNLIVWGNRITDQLEEIRKLLEETKR